MEHFLELTARDLLENYADPQKGLSHITVVFPNRRARLFFDEYLSAAYDRPMWSPGYMTIDELFQSLTDQEPVDRYKAVAMLYRIYRAELHCEETLDSFWGWGELMLGDFDDLDRNLADAQALFTCLQNHKEIEGCPFLSEDQEKILKSFFEGFKGHDTELKRKYISIWSALGPIYRKFREELRSAGTAYDGMLQRDVVESPEWLDSLNGRTFAFVGFNSLDKAEKKLFHILQDAGKALFYWDYDRSYVDDPAAEAGLFVRDNLSEFPNRLPDSHFDNINSDKKLTIVETSTDNAQARYVAKWLEQTPDTETVDKDTAVVLCDSGLLQPLLHSIPDGKASDVNITMGFPLSAIPLSGFVISLLDVQRSLMKDSRRLTIALAGKVLNNPLTSRISSNAAQVYAALRNERQTYPSTDDLRADEALSLLFAECQDNLTLTDNLLAVLKMLAPTLKADNDDTLFQPLYSEGVYRVYTSVSRFRTLIEDGSLDVSTDMLCHLIRKVISTTSIPFHGEPVIGMQIMGMIETRNLDFRRVLLLSASEGILPAAAGAPSFIPYSLRNAFGLTTLKEKSAVAAYNFHHLLQRAEQVTMVFNGNASDSGTGSGQMSRYLLQLMAGGRTIDRIKLESDHSEQDGQNPLSAGKDDAVISQLHRLFDSTLSEKNYLSPSALNCYIDCKYQFYLKYIAGITAREDNPEEIDAAKFGSLFHLSAELAYNWLAGYCEGRIISSDALESLVKDKTRTKSFVREAFRNELFKGRDVNPDEYDGTQSINFEVIHKYLIRVLKRDISYAPFRYEGSEASGYSHILSVPDAESEGGILAVRINGRIDRIDFKDGIYRIADYKTGHIEDNPKNIDDLFTPGKNRRKYALQTFYYATLMHYQKEFRDKKLAPALVYIRDSDKDDAEGHYLKMDGTPITDFAANQLNEYEDRLKTTISEMFCRQVPFTQTDIAKSCEYCDFRELCRRKD